MCTYIYIYTHIIHTHTVYSIHMQLSYFSLFGWHYFLAVLVQYGLCVDAGIQMSTLAHRGAVGAHEGKHFAMFKIISIPIARYRCPVLLFLVTTSLCQDWVTGTVSFHNFKSQNFKLSVSKPKSKYVAYLSVLSKISNCQGLGRKNKHEILKTDRTCVRSAWVGILMSV